MTYSVPHIVFRFWMSLLIEGWAVICVKSYSTCFLARNSIWWTRYYNIPNLYKCWYLKFLFQFMISIWSLIGIFYLFQSKFRLSRLLNVIYHFLWIFLKRLNVFRNWIANFVQVFRGFTFITFIRVQCPIHYILL